MANAGSQALLAGVAEHLLQPPMNAYRITLHPEGMAPHIENLAEWAHNLLATLDRQVAITATSACPRAARRGAQLSQRGRARRHLANRSAPPAVLVPLRIRVGGQVQSWFSTNTSIGTPVDITLDGLHVELFHPADQATAALVGRSPH